MPQDIRREARRRALLLCEAIQRSAAGMDARTAPGLGADLVRASKRIAASLSDGSGPIHDAAVRRLLATAFASADELETLLAIAIGLEMLGPRGPRLVREVRDIRGILTDLQRRLRRDAGGHAA